MRKTTVVLMVLVAIAFSSIAMAQTTTDVTWNGSGYHSIHFQSGDDATSDFWTAGDSINGEYHAVDQDDNPYKYHVDTTDIKVKAHVSNGYIEYKFTRDDSHTSYGDAGQESYTLIDSYGTADFAWHSNSNYARLRNCNYGWQNNNQIQATGSHYINHYLAINDHEGAGIEINADGTTDLTIMNEAHWGSGFKFGKGCGCYTNAHVDITGSGTFDLYANADNEITTDWGITTDGYLGIHSSFTNGFHFANFALEGN